VKVPPVSESQKQGNRSYCRIIPDAIIQSIPVGIWISDGEGNIITVNKASEKLSNFKVADVIGKNVEQLVREGFMDI